MLIIAQAAVISQMSTWIGPSSFCSALWLWDSLWFSAFQHCPIPVCLPRRMLPGLPVLLPHSSSGFWAGIVLTDWMEGDGHVCSPNVTVQVPELDCCAPMNITHHCDACLCWYAERLYMSQKICYLMESSASLQIDQHISHHNLQAGCKHQPWKTGLGFILSSSKNNISIFLLKWFNQMLCRLKLAARSSFWAWTEPLDMMSQSAVWIAFKRGLQVSNERQSCKSLTFQTDVCDFCTWWIWSSENPFLCKALIHLWRSVFQYILIT